MPIPTAREMRLAASKLRSSAARASDGRLRRAMQEIAAELEAEANLLANDGAPLAAAAAPPVSHQ